MRDVLQYYHRRSRDAFRGRLHRLRFWARAWKWSLLSLLAGTIGVILGWSPQDMKSSLSFWLGLVLLAVASIAWIWRFVAFKALAELNENDFGAIDLSTIAVGAYSDWSIKTTQHGSILHSAELDDVLDSGTNAIQLKTSKFCAPSEFVAYAPLVFSRLGSRTTDDEKVRLGTDLSASVVKNRTDLELQRTSYFEDRLTNNLGRQRVVVRDRVVFNGTDLILKAGRIIPLENSQCSNQLGGSSLLITADRYLCYLQQGNETDESKGLLAPAGSGSFDFEEVCGLVKRGISSFQEICRCEIERELKEEIGAATGLADSKTVLIGFSRLIYRAGKPELFALTLTTSRSVALRVRPQEWGLMSKEIKDIPIRSFDDEDLLDAALRLLKICNSSRQCSVPLFANALMLKAYLSKRGGGAIRSFFDR